jgi:hypothetical protein
MFVACSYLRKTLSGFVYTETCLMSCSLRIHLHGNVWYFRSNALVSKSLQLPIFVSMDTFNTQRWFLSKNRISAETCLQIRFQGTANMSQYVITADPRVQARVRSCNIHGGCHWSRLLSKFLPPSANLHFIIVLFSLPPRLEMCIALTRQHLIPSSFFKFGLHLRPGAWLIVELGIQFFINSVADKASWNNRIRPN